MFRRLFFTLVFYLFLTTVLSIQCYTGTDKQCLLAPDTNDCGSGETCQCAKYRFQCTQGDQACNAREQLKGVRKWTYTIASASTCQSMLKAPNMYEKATCCSTNGCNQPANGKCSWDPVRR